MENQSYKYCIIVLFMINIVSLYFLWKGMVFSNLIILLIGSFLFGSVYSVGTVGISLLTRYYFGNENYTHAYSIIAFLTMLEVQVH